MPLEDTQVRLEADVTALEKRLDELNGQRAERRALNAGITALLTLSKRRSSIQKNKTRSPKADR